MKAIIAADSEITMTSMELAELCEARHNDVVNSINNLFEKGVLRQSRKTPRQHRNEAGGRPTMVFDLTKRDCLVVASGYRADLRAKIIDRWIELEAVHAKPVAELSRLELIQMALVAEQERLVLVAKVTADAPKVEFAEAVRNVDGVIKVEVMAKTLGWGRNRLFARMRQDGILMADNKPYQRYLDQGVFKLVEVKPFKRSDGTMQPAFTTMVTGKGQVFLQRRYGKDGGNALTVMENRLH